MTALKTQDKSTVSFKDTLNLPRTDFPIRPQAALDDPAMVARWQTSGLYAASFDAHTGAKRYVLHAGPPFSNGHIHLGHAYNVILKDVVTKSYRMAGYQVPVTPGWDCHGLPIEIKVSQTGQNLDKLELIKACRTYAQQWVDIQREEFKRLGAVMDWNRPYITMSPDYESRIIRTFDEFVARGFIQRKNKTVAWCFSCQTVLASAEIEYNDRKDPSLYVQFLLDKASAKNISWLGDYADQDISVLVWTTTPWTLPLNRAVILKPEAEYVLTRFNFDTETKLVILGKVALQHVESITGKKAEVLRTFLAQELKDSFVEHPFVIENNKNLRIPVLFDDSVTLDDGTACMHCAPGCGPADYEIGVKQGLEIYSPLTPDGRYTQDVMPAELAHMSILDAQGAVIKLLSQNNRLFHKASITHSYPHCWRCHTGLMFRATKQWFLNLEHEHVRERALAAIDSITFLPPQAKIFLRSTIENRWEWCLSRQKTWGVPIVSLTCKKCDTAYCPRDFVARVADAVAQEGIEYWARVTVSELFDKHDIVCDCCKNNNPDEFVKEQDIVDVWFESGISHYIVLYNNPELKFPADLYIEAKDQHRGWFQSSLMTAMVLEGAAPTKAIMAHGFTVDAKGQKMSKSLGNVVSPTDVIQKIGTDGLRLWVASIGHESDVLISDVLLNNVSEVFRKIRNTLRFLLSNLYDFDSVYDKIPVHDLLLIDRMILERLFDVQQEIITMYHAGNMTKVFHILAEFCSVDLSSWYLDIVKDRLYVERAQGPQRRSAQTVCWYLLDSLTRLVAPILSFTAEQVSDLYQKDKKESIHLQTFTDLPNISEYMRARQVYEYRVKTLCKEDSSDGLLPCAATFDRETYERYQKNIAHYLREVRGLILKAIEGEREKGIIKHSLEVRVIWYADPDGRDYDLLETLCRELAQSYECRMGDSTTHNKCLQGINDFLKELCIVSQVEVRSSAAGLQQTNHPGWHVLIEQARGVKCPRCWNWDETKNEHNLCRRCVSVLS